MPDNSLLKFSKETVKTASKSGASAIGHYRYFSRWKNSLDEKANSVADRLPWLTFPVIDLLNNKINATSKIFEYGGGGSTLFFLDRAGEVVTVEHDKDWFVKLDELVSGDKRARWKGNFIAPEPAIDAAILEPSNPADYASADDLFKQSTFKQYAKKIDDYTDNYFDIVLVDGRSRPSCMAHSISKIKPGGWLVIDNSDRAYYFNHLADKLSQHFNIIYNKTAPCPYLDFFSQTSVLQKNEI